MDNKIFKEYLTLLANKTRWQKGDLDFESFNVCVILFTNINKLDLNEVILSLGLTPLDK